MQEGGPRRFYNLDGIADDSWAIVVEGEVDALSFMRAGLKNCSLSPMGSTGRVQAIQY